MHGLAQRTFSFLTEERAQALGNASVTITQILFSTLPELLTPVSLSLAHTHHDILIEVFEAYCSACSNIIF